MKEKIKKLSLLNNPGIYEPFALEALTSKQRKLMANKLGAEKHSC